jgi:hypothetical protein
LRLNLVSVFRISETLKKRGGAIDLQSRSRSSRWAALALAIGLVCSGCPALAVPELVYEGYKHEHKKNAQATPSPTPVKRQAAHPVDESIE